MKDETNRKAFLISRFSLVNPAGKEVFKTFVKNEFQIANEVRKGSNGFGYDFILIPLPSSVQDAIECGRLSKLDGERIINNNLSIGELTQEEKNAINNRGKIAYEIARYLKSQEGKCEE